MSLLSLTTRTARRIVVAVVAWAIFVAVTMFVLQPLPFISAIESNWANDRIEVLRLRIDSDKSHWEFRHSVFGDKTDREVVHPAGFDIATAVPVDRNEPSYAAAREQAEAVTAIDSRYQRLIRFTENHSLALTVLVAMLIWVTPILLVTLVRATFAWVRRGTGT